MMVKASAVAITAVGGVLLYSAINGHGFTYTLRSLLSGSAPPVGGTYAGDVAGSGGSTSNAGYLLSTGASSLQNNLTIPTGGSSVNAINSFLTTAGFSRAARAGIMGNMQAESGMNPAASGDGGTSLGICQWHSGRMAALQAYARAKGVPATDLQTQLQYMMLELTGPYIAVQTMVRAAPNAATAAIIWCDHYEVPANLKAEEQKRASYANALYASNATGALPSTGSVGGVLTA